MRESRISTEAGQQYASAYETHYATNDIDKPSHFMRPSHHRIFAIKEMIEIIARALVDEPELVSVREVGSINTSIIALTVAKADIGKVIGKQGRTASALRTFLSAVSAKAEKRTLLEIVG